RGGGIFGGGAIWSERTADIVSQIHCEEREARRSNPGQSARVDRDCFDVLRTPRNDEETASTAVVRLLRLLGVSGGRRRRHVDETRLQFGLDLLEVVRLRLEVARLRPL